LPSRDDAGNFYAVAANDEGPGVHSREFGGWPWRNVVAVRRSPLLTWPDTRA
jgi:hypothetical protein